MDKVEKLQRWMRICRDFLCFICGALFVWLLAPVIGLIQL